MPLALSLFPDVDRLDDLIEATMPLFTLWVFALAIVLAAYVIGDLAQRFRTRSPVEKLLRRRFG